jgi:hypothetical protein
MLKIQRFANGKVVYILSGRMDTKQAGGLDKLFSGESEGIRIIVDLKDLTLVDRDAVRFLERCEAGGVTLENSPAYIRLWIDRERSHAKLRSEHRNLPDATRED